MTSFADRNAIVLTEKRDWRQWYKGIQDLAQRKCVWDYIDPKQDKELKPVLVDEPQMSSYASKENASKISDLTKDELANYAAVRSLWNSEQTLYCEISGCIGDVQRYIRTHVAAKHLYLIDQKASAREALKALQEAFEGSEFDRRVENFDRRVEIQRKLYRLYAGPSKRSVLDQWLDEWLSTVGEAEAYKLPDVQQLDLLCWNFLLALNTRFPSYTEPRMMAIRGGTKYTIQQLVDDFRSTRGQRGATYPMQYTI